MEALTIYLISTVTLCFMLWVCAKLMLFTDESKIKQWRQTNVAGKQKVVNKGNIGVQNNTAHNQTIIQNNTIKNTIAATKPVDKAALLKRAREEAHLTAEMLRNMTPTHYQDADNYHNTSKTAKNDVSDNLNDKQIIRQVMPSSGVLKPNDVVVSSVIRNKVFDKYDDVVKWKHETPSYIARKVFNISGGGSRLQYIAAITEVLETEARNSLLEGD